MYSADTALTAFFEQVSDLVEDAAEVDDVGEDCVGVPLLSFAICCSSTCWFARSSSEDGIYGGESEWYWQQAQSLILPSVS